MSLQTDIDRGIVVAAEIEKLTEELKAIKERVGERALKGPQIPLEDAERDGTQFLAKGSSQIVPVTITADFLAASFTKDSKKHQEVIAVAEGKLGEFYKTETTFKRMLDDGKDFRKKAREILGDEAEPFITACIARDRFGIAKNAIKICWDRARALESEAK